MSYDLYDSRGYVSYGPTISGMRDFRKWARPHPIINKFVEHGWTTQLPEFITALSNVKARASSPEAVRRMLLRGAKRAKDILILSDGVVADNESQVPKRRRRVPGKR